ncbi:hypothetical protein SEVIR_5G379650v4 [Setaria viridis]
MQHASVLLFCSLTFFQFQRSSQMGIMGACAGELMDIIIASWANGFFKHAFIRFFLRGFCLESLLHLELAFIFGCVFVAGSGLSDADIRARICAIAWRLNFEGRRHLRCCRFAGDRGRGVGVEVFSGVLAYAYAAPLVHRLVLVVERE